MAQRSTGPRGSICEAEPAFDVKMAARTGSPGRMGGRSGAVPPPLTAASTSSMTFVSPFASAGAAEPVVVAAAFQARMEPTTSAPVSPTRALRPISAGERSALPSQLARATSGVDEVSRRRSVDAGALASPTRPARPPLSPSYISQESMDARTRSLAAPLSADPAEASGSSEAAGGPTIRETLFADHLSAILNHTLSLCASPPSATTLAPAYALETTCEVDEDTLYSPPLTPDDSPRSSLTGESALEVAHAASSSSHLAPGLPPSALRQPPRRLRRLPSLPSITPRRHAELVEVLGTWEFNAHELDQDELVECASIMFEAALLMAGTESIATRNDLDRLRALLLSLRAAYHARNPYHNFTHATDVLQALYSFLAQLGLAPPLSVLLQFDPATYVWHRDPAVDARGAIGELIRPSDVFTLMIAGIGHDVGHPGLSNAYMVNARTPVAQVYGDKSVLENFHSITLVHMLRRHGFGSLLDEQAAPHGFRKVLAASVLATDMSNHFAFVANLQQMACRLKHRIRGEDEIEADRLLICSGLMKCADISNPTRPHGIARAWSTALLEEWAEQARIEAEFKLPISVVTLNPAEKKAQAKSQVGFINLFTQPLFDAMTSCADQFVIFADACREGRRIWEAIVLQPEMACPPAASPSSLVKPIPMDEPRPSSRRRAPPRPLNTSASDRRRSQDSVHSLTAPDTASSLSSARSPRSPALFQGHSPRLVPTVCRGECAGVTAQCIPCRQRLELEVEDDMMDGGAVALGPGALSSSFDENGPVWPPHPFWPSQALLKAAAAASPAATTPVVA